MKRGIQTFKKKKKKKKILPVFFGIQNGFIAWVEDKFSFLFNEQR